MDLTNLGPMLARAIAAMRRAIGPPTKPSRVRKAIVTRTRRNGLSESAEKGAEMAKAKEKAKVKERAKLMETEIGKVKAQSYLAPTTTKETATANSVIIAASPMKGRKAEKESTLPWLSKAPQRNNRKKC